ncbi:hypothetical protein Nmel_007344 [Mimus melanotis]
MIVYIKKLHFSQLTLYSFPLATNFLSFSLSLHLIDNV